MKRRSWFVRTTNTGRQLVKTLTTPSGAYAGERVLDLDAPPDQDGTGDDLRRPHTKVH